MERALESLSQGLIAIVGPTASGKTLLSLELADQLNAEIISADSRQIYKHLTIGTSKPSQEDLRRIPHHFIDILDPREPMSAGLYGKQARKLIDDVQNRGKRIILVGGSGLYVKAVVDGLFDGPSADPEIRAWLNRKHHSSGLEGLLEELRAVDPRSADMMAKEPKVRRIQRALEVYYSTGVPLSEHLKRQERPDTRSWTIVGLEWQRDQLYDRINRRVEAMMKNGFLEEVCWLRDHGYESHLNALQTVGYKELFRHLEGGGTLGESVEAIKRNTRRFAKRQMTWFRADDRIRWASVGSEADISALALSLSKKVK